MADFAVGFDDDFDRSGLDITQGDMNLDSRRCPQGASDVHDQETERDDAIDREMCLGLDGADDRLVPSAQRLTIIVTTSSANRPSRTGCISPSASA